MAHKNKRKNGREADNRKQEAGSRKQDATPAWHADLHPETKKSIAAVFCFVAAVILALSYAGKGGSVGGALYRFMHFLIGSGYFFAPLTLLLIGFSLIWTRREKVLGATMAGGAVFFISILSIFEILFGERAGGFIGRAAGGTLFRLFDFWGGLVISIGILAVSFLLIFNIPIWRDKKETADEEEAESQAAPSDAEGLIATLKEALKEIKGGGENTEVRQAIPDAPQKTTITEVRRDFAAQSALPLADSYKGESLIPLRKIAKKFDYKKPPLELLQGDRGTPSSGDIKANANIIKRTLENFGIDVEMGEVSVGPTVTQYTLRPAEGVKLARIIALHNDLSLALAAHPIRIEAPIPGRSLVGIEVPNRSISLVGLKALVEHKIFQESTQPLLLSIGRDVSGGPIFADLSKMPHLLIAGATGAGKSVCIHTILASFIYRNPPEILRFILVDPKRVELSIYNDIPHLLTPVITDPKKTIQALRWATKEMDRRYDLLSQSHTRDIASYNAAIAKLPDEELLPYLVIIIDELADLMATFPREVESSIIRLAQMARAVGIHLIVSTQRPSVEVITGLIKANITSRIAFQVASQVDSRTILDMSGAEKLLGNGDMLFLAGDTAKPRRIQGAFVSEQEVKKVVGFLREEMEAPEYDEKILETKMEESDSAEDDFGDDDPLYDEARELVMEAGKASASYLQRRLRVGYARAARLLDIMESRGVVGPGDGAKPREVFGKSAGVDENEVMEV
ncbi:MAG: DNA translocase FtsK [Candidatus Sungbacteria bacterium]|nr:DNA translocase FtsK [Candidatus Sungbacteria bacterium]